MRNLRRRRMLRESEDCVLFEIDAMGYGEASDEWNNHSDMWLSEDVDIYKFSADYDGPRNGKRVKEDPIDFMKGMEFKGYAVWGLVYNGREYRLETPEIIEDMDLSADAVMVVSKKDLRYVDPDFELLKINDCINGRGVYYVKVYDDVPLDDLRTGAYRRKMDTADYYSVDGRTEYVSSDNRTIEDVIRLIDFSSYDFSGNGDRYVAFNGRLYDTSGRKAKV